VDHVLPEEVTLTSDVDDVDSVRQHFRLQSSALLGHSWGTVLALEYALRHPERVSHMILMNPGPASASDFAVLPITDEERSELTKWAQSRTLPAGDVFRARLILALADGASYSQIMRSLQTTAPTISRWKHRFEEHGMAGLDPRHKGSQPRVANAAVQAKIARKTQQKPADGSTHGSCRKMAAIRIAHALSVSMANLFRDV